MVRQHSILFLIQLIASVGMYLYVGRPSSSKSNRIFWRVTLLILMGPLLLRSLIFDMLQLKIGAWSEVIGSFIALAVMVLVGLLALAILIARTYAEKRWTRKARRLITWLEILTLGYFPLACLVCWLHIHKRLTEGQLVTTFAAMSLSFVIAILVINRAFRLRKAWFWKGFRGKPSALFRRAFSACVLLNERLPDDRNRELRGQVANGFYVGSCWILTIGRLARRQESEPMIIVDRQGFESERNIDGSPTTQEVNDIACMRLLFLDSMDGLTFAKSENLEPKAKVTVLGYTGLHSHTPRWREVKAVVESFGPAGGFYKKIGLQPASAFGEDQHRFVIYLSGSIPRDMAGSAVVVERDGSIEVVGMVSAAHKNGAIVTPFGELKSLVERM